MKCKFAVCYVGSPIFCSSEDSHSDNLPTVRTQEMTALKYAEEYNIQLGPFFSDFGKDIDRLTAPNFLRLLRYLERYKERHNAPCLVIIHSEICVARSRGEFIEVSIAISKAGGVLSCRAAKLVR